MNEGTGVMMSAGVVYPGGWKNDKRHGKGNLYSGMEIFLKGCGMET
jgi:hypothetical protein